MSQSPLLVCYPHGTQDVVTTQSCESVLESVRPPLLTAWVRESWCGRASKSLVEQLPFLYRLPTRFSFLVPASHRRPNRSLEGSKRNSDRVNLLDCSCTPDILERLSAFWVCSRHRWLQALCRWRCVVQLRVNKQARGFGKTWTQTKYSNRLKVI